MGFTKICRLFALTLLLFSLSSCYNEVNMEDFRSAPIPVLNCIASTDTVVLAKVSHSVFFTDHRNTDLNIDNAVVHLIVNSNYSEILRYDKDNKFYVSSYKPSTRDTLQILAETDIGTPQGLCIIPRKTSITKFDASGYVFEDKDHMIWGPSSITYGYSYEITYYISIDDLKGNDFYCIRIEGAEATSLDNLDFSVDEVFTNEVSSIEIIGKKLRGREGRTFTDILFDGKSYTIRLKEKGPYYNYNDKPIIRKVILYSLSEDYYKYLTDVLNYNEESINAVLGNFGLSEPHRIFSNIEDGTGILGAVQTSSASLNLRDCLQLPKKFNK